YRGSPDQPSDGQKADDPCKRRGRACIFEQLLFYGEKYSFHAAEPGSEVSGRGGDARPADCRIGRKDEDPAGRSAESGCPSGAHRRGAGGDRRTGNGKSDDDQSDDPVLPGRRYGYRSGGADGESGETDDGGYRL